MSLLLLNRFKKALVGSFDEQLQARALLIMQKTNVIPRIVPLPQGAESFVILYTTSRATDTLFKPGNIPFAFPSGNDTIAVNSGWRTIKVTQSLENGGDIVIVYALPSDSIDEKLHDLTLLIWLVLPIGFLLSAIMARYLASRLIRPVVKVIDLANSINLNNNTGLLEEPDTKDELKELIVSFNRMLIRIQEQSGRQTAFFASASHELRTPLSIMQTRLQVLMQDENNGAAIKELYQEQLREVKQLAKMVNDFLLMSELQSGQVIISKSEASFSDLLSDLISKYKNKAASRELIFKISYHPVDENYELYTDIDKLNIIIGNLLDNAIKYSAAANSIELSILKTGAQITLVITNKIRTDISPQAADVKNKFYHSKPLDGEGFGLGLWIASQLAAMLDMEFYCSIQENEYFEATLVM